MLFVYIHMALASAYFPVLVRFPVPLKYADLHVGEGQRERSGKCLHLSLFPSL